MSPAHADRVLGHEEWLVIRVIAVFSAVVGLAYVLGLPVVQRWERRLGISQLAIAGLPFIAIGMVARAPAVGILDDALFLQMSPLLAIALAVVGIRIGLRVDVPHLLRTPRAVASVAASRFALAGLIVFLTVTLPMLDSEGGFQDLLESLGDSGTIRDAGILALAGTITSAATAHGLSGILALDSIPLVEKVVRLGELASIVGLLVLGAYLRPPGLPAELWLVQALGVSVLLGLLVYQLLHDRAASGEDAPVIAIGSVSIVAGVASYLQFSPLAIGMIVGVTLGQLSGPAREQLEDAFDRYQRAIYGFLLFVLGALALPLSWRGAAIAGLFVLGRAAGLAIATKVGCLAGRAKIEGDAWRRLAISPLGATSIAIIIAAREAYPDADLSPAALAVIAATIVSELAWQALRGGERA